MPSCAAEADDNVRVVILGGEARCSRRVTTSGPRRCSRSCAGRPAPDAPPQRRDTRGRREPDAPGVALLLPEHAALAQSAQDHRRPGARRGLRRRADADVGVRPDRCRRGHGFADVVGTRLGMCGVEYFAHPWEFGAAQAKELLLTGDSIDADEAYRLGMVSKIFPADELGERTLDFARRIAKIPTMAALLIKESVNQTQDNQGFYNALNACFTMHELNHAHWAIVHDDGMLVAKLGEDVEDWRGTKLKPSQRDTVEAV